ncbi:MAG: DnaD domain protein [Chloroflexota bacterium]|nr:DnaD domain protein [Chloroflexota bacterium]
MKPFAGFPLRMHFTPVPNLFLSQVLPHIDDIAELKVTLHLFRLLYQRKGAPRFAAYGELASDKALMAGLGGPDVLQRGLERATSRGVLLRLTLERGGSDEDLYFLNDESGRSAVEKIEGGEIDLGPLPKTRPCADAKERPNIFVLYEENIGMLTPLIADELREAETLYPGSWIEDAFGQAVSHNKRSWRYISRILERWSVEGRENGKRGGDTKEDRDRRVRETYGHLVRRGP